MQTEVKKTIERELGQGVEKKVKKLKWGEEGKQGGRENYRKESRKKDRERQVGERWEKRQEGRQGKI